MQTRAVQVSILWNEGSKYKKTVSLQLQNTVHPFVLEWMYSWKIWVDYEIVQYE